MPVPALIFDCDGVLADTERYGHLPAFNQTFREFGLPVEWTPDEYAQKVLVGGGKERMKSLLTPEFVAAAGLPSEPAELAEHVARWHRRKTEIYVSIIAGGTVPARPGIRRIVEQAAADGWGLAVASTSAEESVRSVLEHAVGHDLAAGFAVFAGDVVAHKKPAPDIYQLAISGLDISTDMALVIEDSNNGLRAALGAGLPCVVTVSGYTRHEDFTDAALVVSSLGDPGTEVEVLSDPFDLDPRPFVQLADLRTLLSTVSTRSA
jgi:HAD superfamily hydrolase (TIGR01509 family)